MSVSTEKYADSHVVVDTFIKGIRKILSYFLATFHIFIMFPSDETEHTFIGWNPGLFQTTEFISRTMTDLLRSDKSWIDPMKS